MQELGESHAHVCDPGTPRPVSRVQLFSFMLRLEGHEEMSTIPKLERWPSFLY